MGCNEVGNCYCERCSKNETHCLRHEKGCHMYCNWTPRKNTTLWDLFNNEEFDLRSGW